MDRVKQLFVGLFVCLSVFPLGISKTECTCFISYLELSTACTIATSIVHFKLDYCNSLYYKLPGDNIVTMVISVELLLSYGDLTVFNMAAVRHLEFTF